MIKAETRSRQLALTRKALKEDMAAHDLKKVVGNYDREEVWLPLGVQYHLRKKNYTESQIREAKENRRTVSRKAPKPSAPDWWTRRVR